uniref:Uncharacterized protein n=1 Tax=Oryza meridionalis TaxID=40149 RepID=A0A0E0DJ51_9ORYZ
MYCKMVAKAIVAFVLLLASSHLLYVAGSRQVPSSKPPIHTSSSPVTTDMGEGTPNDTALHSAIDAIGLEDVQIPSNPVVEIAKVPADFPLAFD